MQVGKISFRGGQAPVPQQPQETQQQSKVSFKANPIDEEKSNATKYMIGATAIAGLVALGIAGYKGYLGKGIQKFLGGVDKATKNTAENLENGKFDPKQLTDIAENAMQKTKKLTSEQLTNILNKNVKDASEEEIVKAFFAKHPDEPGVFKDLLMKCVKELDRPGAESKVSDAIEQYMKNLANARFAQRMVDNWP